MREHVRSAIGENAAEQVRQQELAFRGAVQGLRARARRVLEDASQEDVDWFVTTLQEQAVEEVPVAQRAEYVRVYAAWQAAEIRDYFRVLCGRRDAHLGQDIYRK